MSNEAMSHEEVMQSIPAYAVGGLDDEEAAAVEEHLRSCETCRRELASYEPLLGGLGLAAPESPPPEGARERLLERLPERPEQPRERSANVRSLWSSRGSGSPRQRLPWMAAAASLLLALFSGGAAWQMHAQVSALNEEVAVQEEAMSTGRDMMGRADLEVSEVLNSESGVRTRIYHTPDGDLGMFVFDHLPELAEDEVYQLWVDTEDGMESEGTFRPMDERGSYLELVEPPGGFDEYESVGVAVAPKGGLSEAPPDSEMLVRETLEEAFESAENGANDLTDSGNSSEPQVETPDNRTDNGEPGAVSDQAPEAEAPNAEAADSEAAAPEAPEPSVTGGDAVSRSPSSQAPTPEGAPSVETPETPVSEEDPAARAPLARPTQPERPVDTVGEDTGVPETPEPAPGQELQTPDSLGETIESSSGGGGTLDGGSESPELEQYGNGES